MLRDAAKIQHNVLMKKFSDLGLQDLRTAPCIFYNEKMNDFCFVDNLLIFAKDQKTLHSSKLKLSKRLILEDLGRPSQFLDIELNWYKKGTVCMQQTNLITKLLTKHEMERAKPAGSPICPRRDTLTSPKAELKPDSFT